MAPVSDADRSRKARDKKRGKEARGRPECGTRNGAKAHRYHREDICAPCLEAERAYVRDAAARRRARKKNQ